MPAMSRLWKSPAEAVLYIMFALVLLGVVNIFSASFVRAAQDFSDSYYFLKKHLLTFGIGLVLMYIAAKIDYRCIRRWVLPLLLATGAFLIAVHFAGVTVNGARRWINIGFQFQPSELAKLMVIVITAGYLGPKLDRQWRISLLSGPMLVCGILSAVILMQPDMGTAVIVMGLCIALYLIAGLPVQQRIVLVVAGVAGLVFFIYAANYRAERIDAWLHPWAFQQGIGYQTVQSLLAIGSGGFWGTGLGMGASKFYYLPEAHTDFAFAVLCQEMGFIGALAVLVLNGAMVLYGAKIATRAVDGFGRMLAVGLTLLLVGQAAINIAMVTGVLPVIGVPLPFISYGGTSLIVNMLAVGLLISIGRQGTAVKSPSMKGQQTETIQAKADARRASSANKRNRNRNRSRTRR